MHIFKIIFLTFLTYSYSFNKNLPLPDNLANKNIFHEEVIQLNGWSCGYNALFYAICLESKFGKSNKYSNLNNFKNLCGNYLKSLNKQPSGSSSNKILIDLAQELKLSPLQIVSYKYSESLGCITENIKIYYPTNTSKNKINKLLKQARKNKSLSLFEDIKNIYKNFPEDNIYFVHLICHLSYTQKIGHWVLVSVVKDHGKKRVYIFDNINNKITENSEINRYILDIYNNFN